MFVEKILTVRVVEGAAAIQKVHDLRCWVLQRSCSDVTCTLPVQAARCVSAQLGNDLHVLHKGCTVHSRPVILLMSS